MAKRMLSGELRGVARPTCRAKAGEWCRRIEGRSTPHVDGVHAARRAEAIKAFLSPEPEATTPEASSSAPDDAPEPSAPAAGP